MAIIQNDKNYVMLAKIFGVHGVKGLVKIKTFTKNIDIFKQNIAFYNQYNESIKIKISFVKDDIFIANINDVHDRDIAQTLIGQEIYIMRSDLPAEDENEIYFVDLIDMKVIPAQDDQELGIVTGVDNFGASDILEYRDKNNKLQMIAFNERFIKHIDKQNKIISINVAEEI